MPLPRRRLLRPDVLHHIVLAPTRHIMPEAAYENVWEQAVQAAPQANREWLKRQLLQPT
jgi:hypothetical protein